ncbi:serine/arginine-rich splicing factor 2-like [Otolemur garnettii]|uniref:serine/arginine-rich splicing factor 2-like n=1 Tax=Otolemur garnettii TaxID=30611 RepID=UPI000C7F1E34|nr:serine/arginine-rich splicing factor 2-like [Otolemur garnettii]
MSYSRPLKGEVMTSIKVNNLTYHTSSYTLRRMFEKYGPIDDVYIPRDRLTNESRGFAFIRFCYKHHAEDALGALDGILLDGHELQVQLAHCACPLELCQGPSELGRGRGPGCNRSRSQETLSLHRRYKGRSRIQSRSRSRSRSSSRSRVSCLKSKPHSHGHSRDRSSSSSRSRRSTRRSKSKSSSVSRSSSSTSSSSRSRSLPPRYKREFKSGSRSRSKGISKYLTQGR